MPMSVVTYDNLSMPFFIKSDDIEYSIRNLHTLILMNGINVWHESFESKYSAPNEYYTVRNYLISAAIHGVKVGKDRIEHLLNSYYKHYVCNYKYLEIEHFCNAINDFLKGVSDIYQRLLLLLHFAVVRDCKGRRNIVSLIPMVADKINFQPRPYNLTVCISL